MDHRTGLARQDRVILLLALVAAFPAWMLLRYIAAAIPFPYALDYNEGIVWQQMNDIVAGRGYAPINGFPAIVYHYPPVYHLASAAVAALGVDPLTAGRIVSLLATLGTTVLVVLLTKTWLADGFSRGQRIAGMMGAAICLLGCKGVQDWAPLMRVDPLACFLALLGLWLAIRAIERPALIHLAALAFVLSVFTKQNSVLTAVASLGVLIFARPALAIRGALACLVLGSAILALLIWHTDGQVLKHLFLYNINRFDLARLIPNILEGTGETDRGLLALGIAGVAWACARGEVMRTVSASPATLARTIMLAFALLATVSLVATAKYGSSSAYYMQWEASLAMFGGVAVACLIRWGQQLRTGGRPWVGTACLAIPILIILATAITTGPRHLRLIRDFRQQGDRLAVLIRPIKGPILSTEMALLLRTGHPVVWEPAIFRELAISGHWDEQVLVRKIRKHEIAAVLSDGDRGYRWFDEQFSPAITDAMDEALPRKIHVGLRILHLPPLPTTGITRTPTPAGTGKSPAE